MEQSIDPSEHKQRVAAVFNLVSAAYDNEAMRFFPFCADRLVARLQLAPGQKVLDVATGTGVVAVAAAQRVAPAGRVIAIDLAEDMLDQAQRNLSKLGLTNVDLHVMDAEALEFRGNYFDAVMCSFGLFFLPDMAAALRHWQRVTKPGGRVMFTSFGSEAFQPMLDLFREQIGHYGQVQPAELRPYPVEHLKNADNCRALLEQAGLFDVSVHSEQLGYHLRDASQWWDIIWNSGFRGLVSRLEPEAQARFRQAHLVEVERLAGADGIWLNVETLFSGGRKPPVA